MEPSTTLTAIVGGTLIDGTGRAPIEEGVLLIQQRRIRAVGDRTMPIPPGSKVISAVGQFIIPGLMDANVHLLGDMRLENLLRHEARYTELIIEAAQVALRSGLTTVFDTWGPRRALMTARDRINAGEVPGSRIFCAGNIIGLDGPLSADFFPKAQEAVSPAMAEKINSLWVENVGPALTWLTPDEVAREVSTYIGTGVDFVKYASSEHKPFRPGPTAFLAFSPQSQAAMVEQAHRLGITAQAHTTAVEALRVAIEAGSDIIQHCNITGRTPIPSSTLQLLVERKTASTVFPMTRRCYESLRDKGFSTEDGFLSPVAVDINIRNLIESRATLLLATDGVILAPEASSDPSWMAGEDNLFELGQGHFHWLKAMEEKDFPPMKALQAATRNCAVAYGKGQDLGTLEPGKRADLLILDKNPLQSAENYRSIRTVIKDGRLVDRASLPVNPILTRPAEPASAEAIAYRARHHVGGSRHPRCC